MTLLCGRSEWRTGGVGACRTRRPCSVCGKGQGAVREGPREAGPQRSRAGAETASSQRGGRSAMLVLEPGQPGVRDSCCTPRTPEGVRS